MNLEEYVLKTAGFSKLVKKFTAKSRKATLRKRSGVEHSKARARLRANAEAQHKANTPKEAGVFGAQNERLFNKAEHHRKRTEKLK